MPLRAVRCACLLAAVALSGCGGGPDRETAAPKKPRVVAPDQATCAQLSTRTAAHKLARKLVDRVVAPEDESERETIGIIGESLYATCRQPRLPGVKSVKAYHPVKPVLAAVQRDFDEHEINGG
jgi:hypothetical protein